MEDSSSTFNSDRVPRAALGALLVICAIEVVILLARPVYMDAISAIVRDKLDKITNASYDEDVIIFGDSRHFYYNPTEVSQALGGQLEVSNYTWPYSGIETFDMMLDTYLRNNEPPGLLVLGMMPSYFSMFPNRVLMGDDRLYLNRTYNLIPVSVLLPRLFRMGNWPVFFDYVKFLLTPPSMKYRGPLIDYYWEYLVERTDEQTIFVQPSEARRKRQYEIEGSFILHESSLTPEGFVEMLDDYKQRYGPWAPYYDDRVVGWFKRLLDRAAAHGVAVVVINSPVSELFYDFYDEIGVVEAHQQFLEELDEDYPNMIFIEPAIAGLDDEVFGDLIHANLDGAEAIRKAYVDALEAHRGEILELMNQTQPMPEYEARLDEFEETLDRDTVEQQMRNLNGGF